MKSSTGFESSAGVYGWISGFINLERGQSVRSFRLDRMNILAGLAGNPERCALSVHVAGSKGKGSVTGMTAAILEAGGIKTARYASPHVSDFRERLCAGNNFFSEDIFVRAGNELQGIVEGLSGREKLFDGASSDGEEPTFFELMTLWFFLCVRLASVGVMTVETGMGGRLDATNILDPAVSVITLIELEHTEYLGNTIAAIAAEKAGIIKPGRPLVLAEQNREALEVFRERAARKKSPLFYFPDIASLKNVRVSREGTTFDLVLNDRESDAAANFPGLFVPICGEVQAKNAGLAVLVARTAFPEINDKAIREGLAGFSLPARFETVSLTPPFIVDGAHTARSVELCLDTFTALYGVGGVLLFGCAAGKDVLSMAKLCVPRFSRVIITTPGSFKKSNPEEIHSEFIREAQDGGPEILFIPDTISATEKAIHIAREHNLPVLGTGSFYLAGEIRKYIAHN